MKSSNICLTVFLLFYYDILDCKLIDLHLPSAEEEKFMEDYEKNEENKRAEEKLRDEESSEEEKKDALRTLYENGKIV